MAAARLVLPGWIVFVALVSGASGQEGLLEKKSDLFGASRSGKATPSFGSFDKYAAAAVCVGDYGELSRAEVKGAETFTAQEVCAALARDLAVRLASHPAGSCSRLLSTVRRRALAGYREAGFPDATVEAQMDIANRRLFLRVEEGARCTAGEVRVEGCETLDAQKLVERLTRPYPPKDAIPDRFVDVEGKPVARWVDKDGKPVEPLSPVWEAGKPAKIDDALVRIPNDRRPPPESSATQLHRDVKQALADLGYHFPEFSVLIRLDPMAHRADLVVNLIKEGPQATVRAIEIQGNSRDTREDILAHLGLTPGGSLSRDDLLRIKERLWQSGRYVKSSVTLEEAAAAEDGLVLRIELVESPYAPPLREPLGETERIFLKLRDFLANSDRWQGDLVIDATLDGCRLAAVVSPQHGALVTAAGRVDVEPPLDLDYAMVATEAEAGFYSLRRGTHFSAAMVLEDQLTLELTAGLIEEDKAKDQDKVSRDPKPAPSDGPKPASSEESKAVGEEELTAGPAGKKEIKQNYGFAVKTCDRTKGMPPGQKRPPVATCLDCQPSLFLDYARGKNRKGEVRDGILEFRGDEFVCRIEAETGRLLELCIDSEDRGDDPSKDAKGKGDAAAEKSGPRVRSVKLRIRFEQGELQRRLAALHTNAAGSENACDPQCPLSSFLGYLCEDPIVDWALATSAQGADVRGLSLLRRLARRGVFASLDRMLKDEFFAKNPFVIPVREEEFAGFGPVQYMGAIALQAFDELTPRASWPWTLSEEVVYAVMGKSEHLGVEVNRLYTAKDAGPLSMLGTSLLLEWLKSPHAATTATRGLDRLSAAGFAADCRPLLDKDHILGKCLRETAEVLRKLDEEDVAALGKGLDAEATRYLDTCLRVLRGDPDRPLDDALSDLLDELWNAGVKDRVEAALKAIRDRVAVETSGTT